MADNDVRMLLQATLDYIEWLKSGGKNHRLHKRYTEILIDFAIFATHKEIAWRNMFAFGTFREFREHTRLKNTSHALIGLSEYLHENGKVAEPLHIPNYQIKLPDIYEQYFLYLEQTRKISQTQVNSVRRVMASLYDYLETHKLSLEALKIEHLDAFMSEFKVGKTTLKTYRYLVRGFLKYLYHERKIIRKNLAPLLVGSPVFAYNKPPRFLRPQEVQKLFSNLKLSTPTDIRTCAMVYLAYTLGMRPIEISKISLDDISFGEGTLRVPDRKTKDPVVLPVPEMTIRAIAAYMATVRPDAPFRQVFLTSQNPIKPVSSNTVVYYIGKAMKKVGLSSSAYWLRHTYAQNLLQIGRSIFEIKEMLGHQNIQSSQAYLHIDTQLMRKVLFDETL